MVGQMRTLIPQFDLLELLAHLSAGSCFELNGKVRTLFGAASIIVAMSVSLSSALADIEEATSQDPVAPDYTQHALPRESMIHFLMDNYDGLTGNAPATYYSISNNTYGQYKADTTTSLVDKYPQTNTMEGFGNVFIPDAVWTLDENTETYLSNISGGLGASFGDRHVIDDSWFVSTILTTYNQDIVQATLHLSSSQFQVESCMETSSLDYCKESNNSENKHPSDAQQGTQDNGSNSLISPNVPSTPTQNQPNTFYGPSLMPASVNDLLLLGASLTTLQDQCDDMYVTCAATQIKPPTPPIDSPIWSIDSPTITVDHPVLSDIVPNNKVIYYTDYPTQVLDPLPISTQPLVSTPIPEISTELMTIVGFVTMIISCKRKAFRLIRQGVARTFYKSLRSLFIATLRRDLWCDNIGQ